MTHERHSQLALPDLKLHDDSHSRSKVVRNARWLTWLVVLLLLLGLGRTLLVRRSEAAHSGGARAPA